ncbi:esterase B1-like [Phlebotomus argentipes]|uniref:esterase B1-like n=1 Tax=Phlebotomus argentipes TaxID=94469 RepID=UPI002892B1B5|nr:esterase B1-like [Phlebotomus argentipes]
MPDTIVARTALGLIRGVKSEGILGAKYLSFFRIPYAKPPLGDLRFRDPQPPESWEETLDCTVESQGCAQNMLFMNGFIGDEDCLHVNVYTKNLNPKRLLPVMLYIHGGGFVCGAGTTMMYGPDFIIERDVVLVTFHYRVGALGFLSLQDPTLNIPGNAGLKDQVMALKWVRDNISFFGGDPNNVTLFGESAGGASVHFMLLTDQARGLFHRAIVMSGTAYDPWAFAPDLNWAGKLAKSVGWTGEGGEAGMLESLMKVSQEVLAEKQGELMSSENRKKGVYFHFGPAIEPQWSVNSVITSHPRNMARTAWGNSIPIMIGGCVGEGLMSYKDISTDDDFLGDLTNFVPFELGLHPESGRSQYIAKTLRDFYFNGNRPSAKDGYNNHVEFIGDKFFWHGLSRLVRSRCEAAPLVPTFFYRFALDTEEFNLIRTMICGADIRGVCHGDELGYLFRAMLMAKLPEVGSIERKTIDRMVSMWTSFAISGNPNCEAIAPVKWFPVSPNGPPYRCLNIAEEVTFPLLPETERLAVWDSLYERDQLI